MSMTTISASKISPISSPSATRDWRATTTGASRQPWRRGRRAWSNGTAWREGAKADTLQFALTHLVPGLNRGRQSISRAKAEAAERKAKLGSGARALRSQHSAEFSEMDELERAIAAAESAVEAAHEEVRVETSMTPWSR